MVFAILIAIVVGLGAAVGYLQYKHNARLLAVESKVERWLKDHVAHFHGGSDTKGK